MAKAGLSDVKTYLGFDYGTHVIGVAVGQTLTKTARPLTQLMVSRQGQIPWDDIDIFAGVCLPDSCGAV